MTNATSNTSTAKPETAIQSKQMILKEVGAKWGKFSEQDLSALKGKDDLVNQVVAKYGLEKGQAQRDVDALLKGRQIWRGASPSKPRSPFAAISALTFHKDFVPERVTRRKQADSGRFRLQVDGQTKGSYASYEAAETAGTGTKKHYPILQVAVYDSVGNMNKVIELP
jgi:hypothetical protein